MKKIEAFIRPEKLDEVVNALEESGYSGLSITESRGHGKQRGENGSWHGQYKPHTFQTKLRLELVVHDGDANRVINAMATAARTSQYGDGKIFISDIADALRIRTNQRGEVALD
jgi:nitrogen regulatory protein P-II 1